MKREAGSSTGRPVFQIDLLRPIHRHERLRGDQLAVGAIDHVEEAVLRRLHQHLARLAIDAQIREHDVLSRGEVPRLARRRLVVPHVLAGVGLERDDGAQEQIVAAAGAAVLLVPRRAIAGADVQQIELRIVGHRIPDRCRRRRASTTRRARSWRPARGSALRTAATDRRHGIEPPQHLARLRVVGGDVAAHAELGAAITDDDFALDDARRAGDRVRLRLVDGDHRPDSLPVAASSATSRPSSVPTNSLPSYAATPRLTVSQHAFTPVSPGTFGSYCHSSLPLVASIACTLLHALVE
jgi:hypothetical protein